MLCECDYLTAAVSASLHVMFCAIPALSSAPWEIHLEFNFTHQEFSRDKEGWEVRKGVCGVIFLSVALSMELESFHVPAANPLPAPYSL